MTNVETSRMTINQKPKRAWSTCIAAILLLVSSQAYGQNYTVMPAPFQLVQDNSGHVINGGCVWTYNAGTTNPATTYSDTVGTPNTNPIKADSAGRFTAYLLAGANYKFVYENTPCTVSPPVHGATLITRDNVAGVPASAATVDVTGTAGETISAGQCAYLSDGSGSKTAGQWFKCDTANSYSSVLPEAGIATSAIVASATGTIRLAGSVTGLSSLAVGSSYYVGSGGALTSSAPAFRRFLGVADTATSLVLSADPLPTNWTYVTTTATGTQDNFNPGISGNTVVRCINASDLTITGFPAGYAGQLILLQVVSTGNVFLSHNTTSVARLWNYVSSGTTPLANASTAEGGSALYVYDGTSAVWRMAAHHQGQALSFTPTIGGSTSQSSQTYTNQVGRYVLEGNLLHYQIQITLNAVGTITGNVRVQGLPYTAVALGILDSAGAVVGKFATLTTPVVALGAFSVSNTSQLELTKLTAAATGVSAVVQGDLATGTALVVSGTVAVQ